jgi:hypothetical protein
MHEQDRRAHWHVRPFAAAAPLPLELGRLGSVGGVDPHAVAVDPALPHGLSTSPVGSLRSTAALAWLAIDFHHLHHRPIRRRAGCRARATGPRAAASRPCGTSRYGARAASPSPRPPPVAAPPASVHDTGQIGPRASRGCGRRARSARRGSPAGRSRPSRRPNRGGRWGPPRIGPANRCILQQRPVQRPEPVVGRLHVLVAGPHQAEPGVGLRPPRRLSTSTSRGAPQSAATSRSPPPATRRPRVPSSAGGRAPSPAAAACEVVRRPVAPRRKSRVPQRHGGHARVRTKRSTRRRFGARGACYTPTTCSR